MKKINLGSGVYLEYDKEMGIFIEYKGRKKSSVELILKKNKLRVFINFLNNHLSLLKDEENDNLFKTKNEKQFIVGCSCLGGVLEHYIVFNIEDNKEIILKIFFGENKKNDGIIFTKSNIGYILKKISV